MIDEIGDSIYETTQRNHEEILIEFPRLDFALKTIDKNSEIFQQLVKPCMSSCSRGTFEVYFEDKNGNRVGVKGDFERDKDPAPSQEAPSTNSENTADSWDRDFE